jgi:hypothetical protein
MGHGVCEILSFKILLKALGYDSNNTKRLYCDNKATNSGYDFNNIMRLYCDSKAANNIAHNPV